MAFQRDTNFFGVEGRHGIEWPVLQNPEADFHGITPDIVESIYGKK